MMHMAEYSQLASSIHFLSRLKSLFPTVISPIVKTMPVPFKGIILSMRKRIPVLGYKHQTGTAKAQGVYSRIEYKVYISLDFQAKIDRFSVQRDAQEMPSSSIVTGTIENRSTFL